MLQADCEKIVSMAAGQNEAADTTLYEVGLQWLICRRTEVKESTYIKYETIWRVHIAPALGFCALSAISSLAVEGFKAELLRQGLAPKTVRDILTVLKAILQYAAQFGHPELAAVKVRYPREPRKQTRVLAMEEQRRLVAFLRRDMDCCKFGILLALMTGIRLGELCALRWGNISLTNRSISITATMQRLPDLSDTAPQKTKIVISSPKTDAALRTIPMSDTVAKLCRTVGIREPDCFALTGTRDYMEPRTLQHRLEEYTLSCGLEGVHFHTLRHTFATRSVEVGFEIKSLSEILGHSNTSITLNRYVHASMDLKRSNMNKLARAGL